jgi:hypothetical protein
MGMTEANAGFAQEVETTRATIRGRADQRPA